MISPPTTIVWKGIYCEGRGFHAIYACYAHVTRPIILRDSAYETGADNAYERGSSKSLLRVCYVVHLKQTVLPHN